MTAAKLKSLKPFLKSMSRREMVNGLIQLIDRLMESDDVGIWDENDPEADIIKGMPYCKHSGTNLFE